MQKRWAAVTVVEIAVVLAVPKVHLAHLMVLVREHIQVLAATYIHHQGILEVVVAAL
jgi:hypothetical protein